MPFSFWEDNKKFTTTKYDLSHPLSVGKMIILMKYRESNFLSTYFSYHVHLKNIPNRKFHFTMIFCSIYCCHHIFSKWSWNKQHLQYGCGGKSGVSFLPSLKKRMNLFLIVLWIECIRYTGYIRSSGKEEEGKIPYHNQQSNLWKTLKHFLTFLKRSICNTRFEKS